MAILQSVRQLAATCFDILQTRLELATVEIEAHFEHLSSVLLRSLIVLFCICSAVVLLVILLLAIFWDTYRITVICALITVFAGTAAWLWFGLREQIRQQPRLLSATLSELEKDIDALRGKTNPAASTTASATSTATGENNHV